MDNEQPLSPRRRLQALLAIPDSQRTEAQWDEIVELEITLAPGNRENGPGRDMRLVPAQPQPQRKSHNKPNKPPVNKVAAKAPDGAPKASNKPNRNKSRGKQHNKPKPVTPDA
ncbi:hypothetical protein EZJ19_03430 [Parasulfuritortus cantonensis]|uniref:Uncharacterized protein n=1 Tax=Parasulfuritortus cantonensis TaxID=2528202 RepID=A0A4R1BKV4_9PROT|nr:hypothetical protein [Parasulfuritortus cantonensis]TCJ17969.1 hypothetical protein EZJ19_03430 [Parasulfuritortus cantonensis]